MRSYPYGTARALLAFRDPANNTELATIGALMWAEHIDNTRALANFVKGFSKGGASKGGKRKGLGNRGRRR